ncbi:glycosyltransferase [Neobacillus sp. PS3-12]|uniref:glycosyltransferase n=1 Tax=Neobacillus sp. PS3-12 TaxID=3070677 RepID=UPI0027DFAAC8|nr:glycosyltransferase [Neobacillus sp. PS3-12]WML54773.1 glycosyltransferase [Neobacillus sp. PS3-12]
MSVLNGKMTKDLSVILYDNSPNSQHFDSKKYENVQISYKHDPRNLGIASAYNYALEAARENGSEWLMLLDHDTEITSEYTEAVMNCDEQDSSVAAIVPKINSENQMISPIYSHTLRPLQGDKPVPGIQERPVMAINSGALIRIEFLNKIGGFNEEFPLDYLDHWLFHVIYDHGYKVRLLDVMLEHELSVMDYSRVSLKRYQSILESEIKYFRNYQQDLYKAYRIQLAKRFLKQVLTVKNKKIALYTLRRFFSM